MGYTQRTTVKLLGDHPKTKYVVVPKSLLLDADLTPDARLVGMYLLSLSDGWEINQRQIAEALGWPFGSHRPTKAVQMLVARGWLRHNTYKKGNRVFKHVYVMNRDRRFSDDDSSSYESDNDADQEVPSDDDSSTYSDDDSSSPPKYQKNNTEGLAGNPSEVITTSADAEREDPWVSGGTVVGSKEGHPQKNKTPVDRSTVDINDGDALPGRPLLVVGPLKSSACGGDPMEDISKEGAIMCLLCNRPIDLGRYAAIPFGGGSAHSACIELADKDSLGCPHCPRGDFATAEELNAHVRVHHQPPLEASPPWG